MFEREPIAGQPANGSFATRRITHFTHCVVLPIVAVVLLGVTAGCSQFHTEYGESEGVQGNKSLNGFGAFRAAISDSDGESELKMKVRDIGRLSSRADRFDAIVWLPKAWPPANEPAVTTWMNRWLKKGDKTMVFVVPDGGSTEAYFREASAIAPPEQRLEYRRRLANQINDRLLEDRKRKDVKVDDWFVAKSLPARVLLSDRQIVDFDLGEAPPPTMPGEEDIDLDDIDMTDVDDAELMAEIDAMLAQSEMDDDEMDDESAEPEMDESEIEEVSPITFERIRQEDTRVASRSKKITTLARVTDTRWNGSQVMVVASGSLVTNFAMTSMPAMELTNQIRDSIVRVAAPLDSNGESTEATAGQSSKDAVEVAILSSDAWMIPISNAKPGAPTATGMELLTTWPLSLVTMHGLFLGVVMCLMLLPAFGRARRVTYNRTTHFGNHLSAMAALMRRGDRKVDGTLFARTKISQYLRLVRGETSGPWVMPEPELPQQASQSPPPELSEPPSGDHESPTLSSP